VEKQGCIPVDRNVQPPEQNLILELSCGFKAPQPQPTGAANVAQKARDEANRGWWYETGQIGQIDGKPDYQAAMRWYLKAVDDGDAIANWNVGRLYEFGFGVPIDLDKAKAWYQKGADKGDMNAQDYLANLGHNRKY
jgi:TPR repeat protein